MEISEKFANKINASNDAKYLVHCITDGIEVIFVSLLLVITTMFIAIVMLFFGIERPYLLSLLISILILLIHSWIKRTASLIGLIDNEMSSTYKVIAENQPATYEKWKINRKKKDA